MSTPNPDSDQPNLQKQCARLSALASLDLLQQPFCLEDILQRVVEIAEQFLPSTGGASIILWDCKKEEFYTGATTVPNQPKQILSNRVRKANGATRWIVDNGQPVIVADIARDPFSANPMLLEYGLKAYAGVPVFSEGLAIGVLYALDRDNREYALDDINFLNILAGRAGNAIAFARLFAEVDLLAKQDSLTGIYNRRAFFAQAQVEFGRAKRHGRPLSILVVDLDNFKSINDTWGHTMGDLVLTQVAEHLRAISRQEDFLARYGGDEFVILLPETDLQGAEFLAERFRNDIEKTPVGPGDVAVHLTTSIGIATLLKDDQDVSHVVQRADSALYSAKGAGKNCIRDSGRKQRGPASAAT